MLWLCAIPPMLRPSCGVSRPGRTASPAPWVYARPITHAATPNFLRRGPGPIPGSGQPGFRSFAPTDGGELKGPGGAKVSHRHDRPRIR